MATDLPTPWGRARKTRSVQQEKRLGTLPGGQTGVNSGRLWRFKRDGRLSEFLIEARDTEAGSYRVERQEFLDITHQALQTPPGLLPGMQIDIQDLQLLLIRLSDFNALYERMLQMEAQLDAYRKT